jgi:hypothetical protein
MWVDGRWERCIRNCPICRAESKFPDPTKVVYEETTLINGRYRKYDETIAGDKLFKDGQHIADVRLFVVGDGKKHYTTRPKPKPT